ncbi:MAG: C39 family peptidase, partial [Anaerolineaceae bacterium]|nr:C39 family peptidase [Anaerolineaceae bacterium]
MTKQTFIWKSLIGLLSLMIFLGIVGIILLFVTNREFLAYVPQTNEVPVETQASFSVPTIIKTSTLTPFMPLPTSTITPTYTTTVTLTVTHTVTLTFTPTAIPTDTPYIEPEIITFPPDTAFVQGIYGHDQLYSLDCEARSAVDLARYFGIQIDEIDFLAKLPKSDDPNEGFVGDFDDPKGQIPPDSYGVYANPIARLLRNYGLDASARMFMTLEELKIEIASGRPVMVWVIGYTELGIPLSYTPSNGNTTTVAYNEHTVMAIGYEPSYVLLLDPTGNLAYWRTTEVFLAS